MKCIILLFAVVSCASAYVYLNSYPYSYGSYNPFVWRKKRSAPEAPAEDQQADPAMYYASMYGLPYSNVYSGIHYLKKREAPAEDQQADPSAFYYNSMLGYPYSGLYSAIHHLKKREVPAEDQQADPSAFYYNTYGLRYAGFPYYIRK